MQCEFCHKNAATLHVTEILDGEKRELHLCEECAREKKIGFPTDLSLSDILGGLIEAHSEKDVPELVGLSCPQCGITYAEFRSGAGLGCPADYDIFAKGLMPFLEKVHGSSQHRGKVPRAAGDAAGGRRIAQLQRQLLRAVEKEDYESAARLRDEIHQLEGKVSAGEASDGAE